jgi:hypothetical protein
MMCYFPKYVVLQGNHHVKESNIDICKLESRVGVQHVFFLAFKKSHVAIWSYMLLEDVMQIFPLLVLQRFVDQFVLICGCEQCTRTLGQFTIRTHIILKISIMCILNVES